MLKRTQADCKQKRKVEKGMVGIRVSARRTLSSAHVHLMRLHMADHVIPSIGICWRLWEMNWQTPASGKCVLMARATDRRGRVQASKRDRAKKSAVIRAP